MLADVICLMSSNNSLTSSKQSRTAASCSHRQFILDGGFIQRGLSLYGGTLKCRAHARSLVAYFCTNVRQDQAITFHFLLRWAQTIFLSSSLAAMVYSDQIVPGEPGLQLLVWDAHHLKGHCGVGTLLLVKETSTLVEYLEGWSDDGWNDL